MVWISTRQLFGYALDIESWKKVTVFQGWQMLFLRSYSGVKTTHTNRHTASSPASQSSPHGAFMKLQPCRITVMLLVSHSWGFRIVNAFCGITAIVVFVVNKISVLTTCYSFRQTRLTSEHNFKLHPALGFYDHHCFHSPFRRVQ